MERLGVQLVSSPRHADVHVVTGPITTMAARALRTIYEQMPEPKKVIALGTCACTGGIFAGGYNVIGCADKVIPVDVKIPGYPAYPGVFLKALARLAGVERDGGKLVQEKTRVSRNALLDSVRLLMKQGFSNIVAITGVDPKENIELIFHLGDEQEVWFSYPFHFPKGTRS